MKKWITTLFVVATTVVYGQKNSGYEAITERGFKSKVAFLSSDLLEGREGGERGSFIAAEYIAAKFNELGLIPANPTDKGILTPYMQPFTVIKVVPQKTALTLTDKRERHTFSESDVVVTSVVASDLSLEAPVVFFTEGQTDYNSKAVVVTDPKAIKSIEGAAAIVLYDSTAWKTDTEKKAFAYHYNEPMYEGYTRRKTVKDFKVVLEGTLSATPCINVSPQVFNALKNADQLSFRIDVDTERKYLRNVVGMIEGQIKDEYVVIGSHFDHLGTYDGYIYNGADDNASGTAAVMQIAEAFVKSGEKPLRTVVFALWDGEERGIMGSRFYTETVDYIGKIKGYLNFDMIGRNSDENNPQSFGYMYSQSAPKYNTWMKEAIRSYKLKLKPNYAPMENPVGGSDNTYFAKNGIPIIWYHTGGHPDFHQPSDHVDKINWEKAMEITRSAYLIFYEMANEQ